MDPLERFARGVCSAPVALMELLLESEDVAAVERQVAGVPPLRDLLARHRAGCEKLVAGLKREPARGQDVLAYQRALFDGWVGESEATSVAFYSLGSSELLARATDELVAWLAPYLSSSARVLDFGCGIGRIAEALAPRVARLDGVDLSANMVDVARTRCAPLANVHIRQIEGRDLRAFADASFELALAVDSFPYVVEAGLERALLSELRRVLAPGGTLVILNYAYDERPFEPVDFAIEHAAQPFTLWNGRAFVLG
ncbi:MAG: class I SAM-dependent methyltransferase [Polyangiales bacterium]